MYLEISTDVVSNFIYDEDSPTGLRWVRNNKVAGTKTFNKYGDAKSIHVNVGGTFYKNHRIVWVLHNGHIDSNLQIDHIDGNPFNNNISNLQVKTQAENLRNQKMNPRNKSGITGVVLDYRQRILTNVQAKWKDEFGKNMCKSFSINKFGFDVALELAIKTRKEQIDRLNQLGFNYTERHIGI